MSTGNVVGQLPSPFSMELTQTAHSPSGLTLAPASLLSSDDAISWLVTMQLQAIKEQLCHPSLTQEERLRLFGRAAVLARRGHSHAPPAPLSSRSASGKRVALNPHLDPSPEPSPHLSPDPSPEPHHLFICRQACRPGGPWCMAPWRSTGGLGGAALGWDRHLCD